MEARSAQGLSFFQWQGADDETTLASRLFNQVLFLCEREQKVPDQNEVGRIRTWISGATLA